ncbi:hypothetical protein [Streptomyces californicus]
MSRRTGDHPRVRGDHLLLLELEFQEGTTPACAGTTVRDLRV